MPYHDNWREERLRNRRDYDNDKRSMSGREKTGYPSSGYWNDDEIDAQRDDRIRRSEYRDYGDNNSRGEYYERNPNWDDNAPYSSKYDAHDYATGQNYAPGDRDISFEERERQRFLNRKRSMRGIVDRRYGDPLFSDRKRLGATGGSSNSYERGNYGDYPVYGSSGQSFSNTEQGFNRHLQERESDNAYARETRYMGTSYRGKGPKDYKRSDARIMEDVCD